MGQKEDVKKIRGKKKGNKEKGGEIGQAREKY